ncbi:MAG: Holliday junction branch migration protein RuvA [Rhodospirillales bacterium]|nr:Holliday junction branch migration protein RuvA [Rhodospirillales bacterium]
MIAKLNGRIDSVGDGWAVIDVGGVGYLVFCSGRTLGYMNIGDAISLLIETHVREDHIHLYGFSSVAERDWFRLLTTVQGVGAKVGLAILSSLTSDDLVQAIASGDKAAINRANGVGPKLAIRILTELKDKVSGLALGQVSLAGGGSGDGKAIGGNAIRVEISEAVSALVNLGYSPSDALGAVSRAAADLGDQLTVESLIRAGLSSLGPSDTATSLPGRG